MRRKIAEHMVLSAHTSPHVYSVYEVNFGRLAQLRDKKKGEYERAGGKLTYTALIARVIVDALRAFPVVNASIDGDNIVYKKDINLGIAVVHVWPVVNTSVRVSPPPDGRRTAGRRGRTPAPASSRTCRSGADVVRFQFTFTS